MMLQCVGCNGTKATVMCLAGISLIDIC